MYASLQCKCIKQLIRHYLTDGETDFNWQPIMPVAPSSIKKSCNYFYLKLQLKQPTAATILKIKQVVFVFL